MYLTTVEVFCTVNGVYLVFPPVMLDMPQIRLFPIRPGNILNIGTAIKAVAYTKYLKNGVCFVFFWR